MDPGPHTALPPAQPETSAHTTRDRHEVRVLALLGLDHSPGELTQQVVVPRHAIRADAVLRLGDAVSPIWGPLAGWLRRQQTVIEVDSGRLSIAGLRRHLAAATLLGGDRRPLRRTRLLQICRVMPQKRLAEAGAHARRWPIGGVWTVDCGAGGQALVVVPRLLPVVDGTSLLRQLFEPNNIAEAQQRVAHFMGDATLPEHVRLGFARGIEMHQIPTTEDEKTLTFDEAYRRAERRGEERGELRGEQRGEVRGRVEGLLRMADALLEAHQLAALKRITDPELLEQRLLAMLKAR